ncbi:MAG: SRPBCC domain-containing protein [Xanthobacteraceae bacterium]|nr:SRPBCC domain-containing protein [Xanthobacteraceae bacterium]MBX3522609.1 SRPBCC domain-containing protein [Xanthobacteraceae bacterium]MBX3535460.1 SRPBCC domain-containing protein [Xanthobacteraceae bacterium]MBX3549608.1 SRPBCC domain-containing protein [Xanthobacteraceae bacterium]MCW5675053.1 SRPBCC domain-containing protein [Xanthobacteraceae bacterium]
MLAKPSVTLKRHIHGRPEQVFAAWTDPKKIVRWFGPQQTLLDTVKAELDVRVGGKFSVSFATDDGEFHKVGGTYREIFPPERLQFTWAWHTTPERESLVTVTIRPDGDGSMLTLLHEQFFDQAAADGHKRGWTGTLEKLAAEFE